MAMLITGFEPFGGSNVNPSERVVEELKGMDRWGPDLVTAILPVHRTRGPAVLLEAVERVQPQAVLLLGQAGRRPDISVERVAINLLDYPIGDNSGDQVKDEPVVPGGPAAYFVTLPVPRIVSAIQAADVPASQSLSAGAYLCNQVTYELLHYLAIKRLKLPAGFIHLPLLPEQATERSMPVPSMSLETMLRAISAAIDVLMG